MEKQILALFAHGRTGTTYFRSLLNTHQDIHCFGEVLFPDFWQGGFYQYWHDAILEDKRNLLIHQRLPGLFENYIRDIASTHPKRIIGFDLKIPQIQETPVLHSVIWRERASVLHLVRENTLRTVVSRRIMQERMSQGDTSVHRSYTPDPITVHLEPGRVIVELKGLQETDNIIRQKYEDSARCPYLRVRYEDLSGPDGPDAVLNQVCNFLGVTPFEQQPQSELKRQNPAPVRELITNINEIERALQGTPYEPMLNE